MDFFNQNFDAFPQLHIEEVGPYSGSAFGGITAIQVLGCLANGKQQTKSDDLKKVKYYLQFLL